MEGTSAGPFPPDSIYFKGNAYTGSPIQSKFPCANAAAPYLLVQHSTEEFSRKKVPLREDDNCLLVPGSDPGGTVGQPGTMPVIILARGITLVEGQDSVHRTDPGHSQACPPFFSPTL